MGAGAAFVPNSTNAVGGWSLDIFSPESHQRSWWIVHPQPTKRRGTPRPQIPPTQLVDRSYPAYKKTGHTPVPNPTNAVGGSFILSLQKDGTHPGPKSHQRSWW